MIGWEATNHSDSWAVLTDKLNKRFRRHHYQRIAGDEDPNAFD